MTAARRGRALDGSFTLRLYQKQLGKPNRFLDIGMSSYLPPTASATSHRTHAPGGANVLLAKWVSGLGWFSGVPVEGDFSGEPLVIRFAEEGGGGAPDVGAGAVNGMGRPRPRRVPPELPPCCRKNSSLGACRRAGA